VRPVPKRRDGLPGRPTNPQKGTKPGTISGQVDREDRHGSILAAQSLMWGVSFFGQS
jgi:hypothetical protein